MCVPYIAVHRYELPEDYRDYRDCRDYRDYLTAMHGLLTGIKSVTGGKLPYFPGNFRVNTKITENNLFCGNTLPGNSEPRTAVSGETTGWNHKC